MNAPLTLVLLFTLVQRLEGWPGRLDGYWTLKWGRGILAHGYCVGRWTSYGKLRHL